MAEQEDNVALDQSVVGLDPNYPAIYHEIGQVT